MAVILSIIVPVFNVERYVDKCIKSLISQDIEHDMYEVILVDDGSSDNSGRICDNYAINHSFISVIHQQNQGLSAARNVGLRSAIGKYILFVDSDDFLQKNVLAGLIEIMEKDYLDILRFKFRRVREGYDITQGPTTQSKLYPKSIVFDGHSFLVNHLGIQCYACQFMIRREFLADNELFFKEGIIYEDTEWTPRIMEIAHRVSETDIMAYNYLEREGSITQDRSEKVVRGQLTLINLLKEQMALLDDKRWYKGMIAHTAVTIITHLGNSLFKQRNYYLKELNDMDIYPLSRYNASDSAKRKIALINLSPSVACWTIHIANI